MINNKSILAITLARGGSKRIPKKNIALLEGRPLIEYTFDAVMKSKYIDRYVVSTDDDEIASFCHCKGVETVSRPASLASDTATSADALIDCANRLYIKYDYIVELMATNPLKKAEDIDGVIHKLNETDSNSVISVVRVFDYHPSRVKYIDNDILCDFYPEKLESRSQDLRPEAYIRNGSIYGMKYDFLIKNKSRYDKGSRPYVIPAHRSINIDEPIDIEVACQLLRGDVS